MNLGRVSPALYGHSTRSRRSCRQYYSYPRGHHPPPSLTAPGSWSFAGEPLGVVHVQCRRWCAEQREQYAREPFAGGLDVEILANFAGELGRGQVGSEEVHAFAQQDGGIFGQQQADRLFVEVLLGSDDSSRLGHEYRCAAELVFERAAAIHRRGHLAIELLGSVLGARFDDGGLVAEVLVYRAARDTRHLGDIHDRGLLQSLLAETGVRGLDDEFTGIGRGGLSHQGTKAPRGTCPALADSNAALTSARWNGLGISRLNGKLVRCKNDKPIARVTGS